MRQWTGWWRPVALACLMTGPLVGQGSGTGAASTAPHTVVTNDMLLQAAQSGDWLMYGHNYWNNRYSPLATINTTNVRNLIPRMVFQTGTPQLGSLEPTPLVANGVMYITTPAVPNNEAIAVDLRTQKTLGRSQTQNTPGSTAWCAHNTP